MMNCWVQSGANGAVAQPVAAIWETGGVSSLAEPPNDSWACFQRRIRGFVAQYTALWESVGTAVTSVGPVVPLSDKLKLEAQTKGQLEEIKDHLQRFPRSHAARKDWRSKLLGVVREMARRFGLPNAGLDLFFTQQGIEATRRFVHEARAFEANMADEDLLQALRNHWVVHSIQALLDKAVAFCPATFGYSMLYPWTDNYLDDGKVSNRVKLGFGHWLEQRLCGSIVEPPDRHAAQVGRLVAFIERVFPRAEFPAVYLSLRAIHHAQMASLQQHDSGDLMDERSLLQITLRKGGTSVLADGYLVAGHLSEAEADFMFGYGVLLQLLDDLQDFSRDLANGHATVFVRQAMKGPLDELTRRLWSFVQKLLWSCGQFDAPRFQPVKALIQESCKLLLLGAVARNEGSYTKGFVAEMESCSPFGFGFLRTWEARMAGENQKVLSVLRRRRQIDSAFDLLC